MLERHTNMLRGQLSGWSGSSQLSARLPSFRPSTTRPAAGLPCCEAWPAMSRLLVLNCG